MKKIDRRSFLRISGMMGIGIAAFTIPALRAESVRFNKKLYKVSSTRLGMGTFVSITVFDPSRSKAEDAINKAFDEVYTLSDELSRFNRISAVAQLNMQGKVKGISPHMMELMRRSLEYYKMSSGCFDITVKPIIDYFQDSFSKGIEPTDEGIKERIRLIGSDKIVLSGNSVSFKEPGMGITLDGIAKGYVVDHAAKVLEKYGVRNYLINAGGDIRVSGKKSDNKPWMIAVQDPNKKGHYPAIIKMTKGAIATSGNYEIYFDREKLFYHIIDPHTGYSPKSDTSVSVVSMTCADADALSTTLFVMEPEKAIRFTSKLGGREAFIITRDGRRFRSPGWNRFLAT